MSIFFVTTNQTSTRVLAAGDGVMITRNGGISVPGGHAVEATGTANSTNVQIDGYAYGRNSGVYLTGTDLGDDDATGIGGHLVQITANGSAGSAEAISGYGGVVVSGSGNVVSNQGQIFASNAGVLAHGVTTTISNGGAIMAGTCGVEFRGDDGVSFAYELVNSGVIEGETAVVRTGGFGETRIVNTGSISALSGGVAVAITGTVAGASSLVLTNSGTLAGTGGAIVAAELELAATPGQTDDRVLNHGLIIGDVSLFLGDDRLRNDGRIDGDVDLGVGDDIFSGYGGRVDGAVSGGDGDDLFLVDQSDVQINGGAGWDEIRAYGDVTSGGGIEVIKLQGGGALNATGDDGDNQITGTSGANILIGGDGNDLLTGQAGTDDLQGGAGNDTLRGGADADVLGGGAGNDIMAGQGGHDELEGGDGNDTMAGHAGDDILLGGLGRDLLVGGVGSDVFIYEALAETSTDLAQSDRISGFVPGEDRIDLSEINEESFAFIGTGAFSAGGGMELRYFVNGVGHSIVQMDGDGDGLADAALLVLGVGSLTASDFIL